jgi:hypothetical protein
MSRAVQKKPLTRLLGERDIHQRRIFGDGKGDRSGDEKNREIRYNYSHRL